MTILKFIGIALLVILLLVLILLLLLLFMPIGYRIKGEKPENGSWYAKATFSWLWVILKGNASLDPDGLEYRVKALWFTVLSSEPEEEKPKKPKKKKKPKTAETIPERKAPVPEKKAEPPEKTESAKKAEPEKKTEPAKNAEPERKTEPAKKAEPERKTESVKKTEPLKETNSSKKAELKEESVTAAPKPHHGIGYTIRQFCDKIKEIAGKLREVRNKAEMVSDYIQDPRFTAGLSLVLKELGRLMRHILPRKGRIHLRFGFEDPFTTGSLMGILSMVQPLFGKVLIFETEYDTAVLEADADCRGILQFYVVLIIALKLFFSKDFTFLRRGPFDDES